MSLSVLFQRADEPEWVAVARLAGLTDDGLVIEYPWHARHAAVDPGRLKLGRWLNLRVSWMPDRDLTAEIERIELMPGSPEDACRYHLRLRESGWHDGPGSAPRTAPLLPRPGQFDAHADARDDPPNCPPR